MCNQGIPEEEIKSLEIRLQRLYRILADELNDHSRQMQEPADKNFIDAVSDNEDKDILQLEDEIEDSQAHKVVNALQRIADNTYGICLLCGKSIPLERLNVIPYAEHCVECEEKLER